MAWSLAFVLLLALQANGHSHCSKDVSEGYSSFCHPEFLDAYIECKDGHEVVSTCAEGLSWSLKIRACVNRMLSECAVQLDPKNDKSPATYCESEPSSDSDEIISFRCHPEDASRFVICPPNRIIAVIQHCPEGRQFSLADKRCVGGKETDCGRALETPQAGALSLNNTEPDLEAADIRQGSDSVDTMPEEPANITLADSLNKTDSDVHSADITGPKAPFYNNPVLPDNCVGPACRPVQPPLPKKPTATCRVRYSYHKEKADWEGARQICEMEGGQLAVITDERAQGRIGSRYSKLHEFWLGATDIEREGQFRWVNGQGLTFARWYSGQPSKKYPNYEDCLVFNYRCKDTYWGDIKCHESRPFLCERMVCQPSRGRFPGGFPGQFRGPLRSPYQFPRNQNFPGPRGMGGIGGNNWPRGRGFPYNTFQRVRTTVNL